MIKILVLELILLLLAQVHPLLVVEIHNLGRSLRAHIWMGLRHVRMRLRRFDHLTRMFHPGKLLLLRNLAELLRLRCYLPHLFLWLLIRCLLPHSLHHLIKAILQIKTLLSLLILLHLCLLHLLLHQLQNLRVLLQILDSLLWLNLVVPGWVGQPSHIVL